MSVETFAATLDRLKGAQKPPAAGSPPYSIYVNRRIGRLLTVVAYQLGMTPNQVTAVSAVFTFSGIAVIALVPTTWWTGILVALLLLVGYAWDSADGQLARLRGQGSIAGEWLDHVVDSFKIATMHLAVVISWYRFEGQRGPLLLLPLAFSAIATLAFFAMILNDQLRTAHSLRTGVRSPARARSALRSVLLLPTDYGLVCLVFVTLGWWPVFPVLYALLLIAQAGHLVLALISWFRAMRRLDATEGRTA